MRRPRLTCVSVWTRQRIFGGANSYLRVCIGWIHIERHIKEALALFSRRIDAIERDPVEILRHWSLVGLCVCAICTALACRFGDGSKVGAGGRRESDGSPPTWQSACVVQVWHSSRQLVLHTSGRKRRAPAAKIHGPSCLGRGGWFSTAILEQRQHIKEAQSVTSEEGTHHV